MTVRARLMQLAERRAQLLVHARAERELLAAAMARTDTASELASAVLAAGRRLADELRRQPLLVAAGLALLFALRPRRALGWLLKGWSTWRLYLGARRWWFRFAAATGVADKLAGR